VPYGDVVLDDGGRPVVFVSAGIGISPMAGMISHLVAAGSQLRVTLLHADANERAFPLRRQLVDDLARMPGSSWHVWYEDGGGSELPVAGAYPGMMNLSRLELPEDALYYLCGPIAFMQAIRSALLDRGVSARDIQYEVFGPDLWQADID